MPIRIGMIGDSRYIGTCLGGLIQEIKWQEENPIQLLQRNTILKNMIERLIGLAIKNLKH